MTPYLYFFSSYYLGVYVLAAIVLLIGSTFLKNKYRTESYNILYVFNTLAAWCSFFILLYLSIDLFKVWYNQNQYEWYQFKVNGQPYSMKWFYFKMYFPSLLGLLLFFKKFKISRLFTLLFLFSLNIGLIEKLMYALRDYQPSAWSTSYDEPYVRKIICYLIALISIVIIYIIAKKRNKLPYPSVFLK